MFFLNFRQVIARYKDSKMPSKTYKEMMPSLDVSAEKTAMKSLTVQDLRSKLLAAREEVNKKQAAIDRKNRQVEKLKSQIAKLKLQVADNRAIDPIEHNTAESMDRFFRDIESEDRYIEFGKALKKLIVEHDIAIDGKSIVDFGCGPGIALKVALADTKPAEVIGYDFSQKALERARTELPGATFRHCDIYEGDGRQYDIVICTEVLEHLEHPERALRTLLSMLKEGGTALLTVPDGRTDKSRYHINFWSPESWHVFISNQASETLFGTFKVRHNDAQSNNFAIVRKRSDP